MSFFAAVNRRKEFFPCLTSLPQAAMVSAFSYATSISSANLQLYLEQLWHFFATIPLCLMQDRWMPRLHRWPFSSGPSLSLSFTVH